MINLIVLLFCACSILAQQSGDEIINSFLKLNKKISTYFNNEDIELSERLGISYEGVAFKILSSYNLSESGIKKIQKEGYTITRDNTFTDGGIIKYLVTPPGSPFYLFVKDGKIIDYPTYLSKNWEMRETRFFRYYIESGEKICNSVFDTLDNFVNTILTRFNVNRDRVNNLQQNKINYYLCVNDSLINVYTGFSIRGMYNLSFDYVISTYKCHLHEVAHLLMNYIIQTPKLYYHPFFQEGFAVALGGRGGFHPKILEEIGAFEIINKLVNPGSLRGASEFSRISADLSYPIAGLLNHHLMKSMPDSVYLSIYKQFGSDMFENIPELPEGYCDFDEKALEEYMFNSELSIERLSEKDVEQGIVIIATDAVTITEVKGAYYFKANSNLTLFSSEVCSERSRKFSEFYPDREYTGEKYLLVIDNNDIMFYDLELDILLGAFYAGFNFRKDYSPENSGTLHFKIPSNMMKITPNMQIRTLPGT